MLLKSTVFKLFQKVISSVIVVILKFLLTFYKCLKKLTTKHSRNQFQKVCLIYTKALLVFLRLLKYWLNQFTV